MLRAVRLRPMRWGIDMGIDIKVYRVGGSMWVQLGAGFIDLLISIDF